MIKRYHSSQVPMTMYYCDSEDVKKLEQRFYKLVELVEEAYKEGYLEGEVRYWDTLEGGCDPEYFHSSDSYIKLKQIQQPEAPND